MKDSIYIISGGTLQHISPHFAICAPAYGKVGDELMLKFIAEFNKNPEYKNHFRLGSFHTRMAGNGDHKPGEAELLEEAGLKYLETNEDVGRLIDLLITKETTKCIIMAAALCDFKPRELITGIDESTTEFGKNQERLSSDQSIIVYFDPTEKLIDRIKIVRKDICLVSFKTTSGVTKEESFKKAANNLKRSSSDIVFVNDIVNKYNGIISSNQMPLWGDTRSDALEQLAFMTMLKLN